MPIRKVENTDLTYYLICYDADGKERTGDPDGQMSQRVLEVLKTEPITDVFLISHGWLGDIKDAISQYDKWIGSMAGNTADIERVRQARPGFHPLLIGLHGPALLGQYRLPKRMRDFQAGDVVVGAFGSARMADERSAWLNPLLAFRGEQALIEVALLNLPCKGRTRKPRASPWVCGKYVDPALKGHNKSTVSPLQGWCDGWIRFPRALPWAFEFSPYRGGKSASSKQALKGLLAKVASRTQTAAARFDRHTDCRYLDGCQRHCK
jgi:hypothetical protein